MRVRGSEVRVLSEVCEDFRSDQVEIVFVTGAEQRVWQAFESGEIADLFMFVRSLHYELEVLSHSLQA